MSANPLILLGGLPIPIPGTTLRLEQPSLELVAMLGEEPFFESMKFCRLTKKLYLARVKEVAPERYEQAFLTDELSIFLAMLGESPGLEQQTRIALELLFPGKEVIVNSRVLMIDNKPITEEQFVFIQQVTAQSIGLGEQADNPEFKPGNEAAKAIEAKILHGRERIAAEKKAMGANSDERKSISGYVSALATGLQLPIQTIMKYTLYQFYDQLKRFSRQQAADSALKAMLAGAKDVKSIDWMGSDEDT